mmetsp:Transcript_3314/g.9472  ORF Transcript_3314/g.9472 Transcript_3314/m.9472 type:complete len:81 (-) Transcript_3314:40-282(-)
MERINRFEVITPETWASRRTTLLTSSIRLEMTMSSDRKQASPVNAWNGQRKLCCALLLLRWCCAITMIFCDKGILVDFDG